MAQQSQTNMTRRYGKILNQQIEILKEEGIHLKDTIDAYIHEMQIQIQTYLDGTVGQNLGFEGLLISIQEAVVFVVSHSDSFSDKCSGEGGNPPLSAACASMTSSSMRQLQCTISDEKVEDKMDQKQTESNDDIKNKLQDLTDQFNRIGVSLKNLEENVNNCQARQDELEKKMKSSKDNIILQIVPLRGSLNDVVTSLVDLAQKVKNTEQEHQNISNKLEAFKCSINLESSKSKQDFEDLEKSVESQIQMMSKKVTQIEAKCGQSTVGFCASQNFKLSDPIVYNVVNISDIHSNYGDHFNSATAKFRVPINGFYMISITTKGGDIGSYEVFCNHNIKPELFGEYKLQKRISVCDNQTVTTCYDLSIGDVLSFSLKANVKEASFKVSFSCFLIK
ncbi:unnamed protein product [Lymnaea stagnalis]|uniref:C1q domain-containing protein n=1 Tax=Lymnaea stagnalis TaxID=6523 RepID=A0AAV2HF43_LYMST